MFLREIEKFELDMLLPAKNDNEIHEFYLLEVNYSCLSLHTNL